MKSKQVPLLARLLVLALAGYAAATLLWLRPQLAQAQEEAAQLRQQLETAAAQNAALAAAVAAAETDEGLAALAWSRLGLVSPGEVVFRVSGVDHTAP